MAKLKTKNKIGFGLIAVVLALCVGFNIYMAAHFQSIAEANATITTKGIDRAYTLAEGTDVNTRLEQEGATLLYNANDILPLGSKKVTILGAGSHNYVQGGTGSAGGRDDSNTAMMDKAFENAGIDYNKAAWTWLDNALGNGMDIHNGSANPAFLAEGDPASRFDWTAYRDIHEFTADTYKQFVTADVIGEYTDVAIVTFSRSGAEGASPALDYDQNQDTTTGRVYLELDDNEKALLAFCKEHFNSTVVLINSAEPIECGFIYNDNYNVDAVLWIGHPGEAGMYGVANILSGKVSPSGHLVDTWTYDMSTNPTFYSANDQTYSNVNLNNKNKYYEYNEGIYVGYRFYETADAEGYFDSEEFKATKFKGNLYPGKYFSDLTVNGSYEQQKEAGPQATYEGYKEVVLFPFGYGLSYTSFSQTITASDVTLSKGGENSITVNVTNTGSVAGKSVVQLYMEAPYKQDSSLGIPGVGLEKAKVVLIGFAKTSELAPGASEEVTIEFSTDNVASFDEFGEGAYVLEKGEYIFHISPNAHGWANDTAYGADYATLSCTLAETIRYKDSLRVGTMDGVTAQEKQPAVNAMNDITAGDGAMLINGSASGTYKLGYLSRSNIYAGMVEIMSYQSDDLSGVYSGNGYVWSADGKGTTPVVTGANGRREAAQAVKTAIETQPKSLEGADGWSEGMYYDYQSILAEGISFGDGKTGKTLYGYGNDSYINEKYNQYGLEQNDPSYLVDAGGVTIAWSQTYYVALDENEVTVKDTDGYVKIFDTEADAAKEGSATKLMVQHMANVPASDLTRWGKFANELSFKEADDLLGENGWHTYGADSVGKVFALAVDGPGEAGNAQNADCTWWPCAVIIAATWNVELAEAEGIAYGHQDLLNNTPYCYAPAMNIHRTPFGGRDFEYYSEDGFISGVIGGHVVKGLQSTGMHVFIKHYALNDSDTNRGGVNTWTDEAAIREIYAKPFEIACKYFNADGIMGSLNSMGMAWSHSGFYTTMTRDEWGWTGMLITDGDGSAGDAYNNYTFWAIGANGGILGSGDISNNKTYRNVGADGSNATNYILYTVHNIGRNALYQYSHNIDKLSESTTGVPDTSVPTMYMVAGNLALLVLALLILFLLAIPRKEKKSARSAEYRKQNRILLAATAAILVLSVAGGHLLAKDSGSVKSGKAGAPEELTYDASTGAFQFKAVPGADVYTVGVSRVINDTTGLALQSINGAALTDVGDRSVYLWSEQTGSVSGLADNDGDGMVDGQVVYRKYSSSATEVGAVMNATDLGVGHYIVTAIASATDSLPKPAPAYLEFVVPGTLAEPTGFVAALNAEGKMAVTAPSNFYLGCLTATGLPEKMLFEVYEGETLVDSFEMDDFSYTNSVNGPNKAFSFNNNTAVGTVALDRTKKYSVVVTAVGDGDQIQSASANAAIGTSTTPFAFASLYDTEGSTTVDGYSVVITLGQDADGKNVYELSASLIGVPIYLESGTYTATGEVEDRDGMMTYAPDTKITFTTDATDFDAPVLDGKTFTVYEDTSMSSSGNISYGLAGDAEMNGTAFSITSGGGMGFGPGPM